MSVSINLGSVFFSCQDPVICRLEKKSALLDFAGPFSQVYQVTIRDKHSLAKEGLKALFISTKHCEEIQGTLTVSKNANDLEGISFYWVIPQERVSVWSSRVPSTIKNSNDKSVQALKECMDNYVKQHLLVMHMDPIKATMAKRNNEHNKSKDST